MTATQFGHNEIDPSVLRQVIQTDFAIGDELVTKQVSGAPAVQQAHAAGATTRNYHATVGSYMRRHEPELGIRFIAQGHGRQGGARWARVS